MHKPIPKFKCPACNQYVAAEVRWTKVGYKGYIRYRNCEICGKTFVTEETVTRLSRTRRRKDSA